MKMENEVLAAHPGTVVEVHVIAGAAVEANAKLLTLIATAT
jgi:biotin carboxyl carrier protein